MKIKQSTKEQNHTLAFIYLGLAAAFIYAGFKDSIIWFLFAAILIGLAGFRLFWLKKKLKKKPKKKLFFKKIGVKVGQDCILKRMKVK